MKNAVLSLVILSLVGLSPQARTLQKANVAADAKWLIHVDLDNFRATQIGQFFDRELIEKKWNEAKGSLKQMLDLDLDWSQFQSLTAYGTDFEGAKQGRGVLLIRIDPKAYESLSAKIDRMIQMAPEGSGFIAKAKDAANVYTLHGQMCFALPKDGLVVLGKSRHSVDQALEVISGDAANLAKSDAFADFPPVPNAFFFLASAVGFNGNAHLPPQAQVLQQADGGRLVLGEKNDNLFLNVSLRAKTSEVCQQIQQIVQGMIALVTISQQQQKPEIMQLIQSVKVSSSDKQVTLAVEYPVAKAINNLNASGVMMKANRVTERHKNREKKAEADEPDKKDSSDDNK